MSQKTTVIIIKHNDVRCAVFLKQQLLPNVADTIGEVTSIQKSQQQQNSDWVTYAHLFRNLNQHK